MFNIINNSDRKTNNSVIKVNSIVVCAKTIIIIRVELEDYCYSSQKINTTYKVEELSIINTLIIKK